MNVEINYLAVVLAALSTMAVGGLWYGPALFHKQWIALAGVKSEVKSIGAYLTVFIASLVSAYVLAHVTFLSYKFFGGSFLMDAINTSFWVWLGFTAARMYVHDTFDVRRKKLTLLNTTHELVTFLVMGLIVGLMGV